MGAALATLVQLRSEYTLRPREPYHAQAPHPALCVALDSAEHQNHAPLALTDSAPNDPLVPTPPSSSFTWPDRRGSSRCLRGKTGRRLKTPRSLKRASRAGRETKLHGTSSHDSAVSEDADWEEEEEVLGTMDCADAFSYFYPPEGAYKELESPSYRLPARTHLSMEELTALYTGTRRVLQVQPPRPAELSSTSAEVGCPLQKPATPEAPCGEVASKDVKDLTPETQNNPSKSTNTYLNNNICQGTGTTMTSRPFHTLVESLRDHCCHHADEPSLSWRAVDRIGTSNRVPTEQDGKTGGNARRVSPAVVHYMGPIQTISFAQLWEKVESFACGLRSLRLKPGDLLAVMEDTRWEWLVSCYAAWSVGLVVVAIPTVCERTVRQVAMDTAHQMKAVICSRSAASMVRRAFRDALMPPKEEEIPSCELDGGAQVLGDVRYSAEPTTNTSGCTSTMSRTPAESSHEARLPTFIIMWSFPFYDSTDAKNARGHGAAGELSAGSPSEGVEEEALWWSDVVQHGHEQLEEMRSMSYKEWASLFRRRHRHHNPVSATQKPLESMSRATTATTGTAGSSVLTSHARPHPSTWGTRPIAPAGAVSAESAHAANATLRAAEVATVPLAPLRPTDIALISYTCGESKGVMLTHAALSAAVVSFAEHLIEMDVNPVDASSSFWVSTWKPWLLPSDRAPHTSAFASPLRPETGGARPPRPFAPRRRQSASRPSYLAYLPLWNPGELVAQSSFLLQNYLLCFGSQRTLLDGPTKPHGDLTVFRPLVFAGVAWTLDRMCRSVQRTLTDGYRRMLFEVAYEARRQALRRGLDTPYLTKAVFAQPRQLLGGRCRLVLCVESTILPRTQEYLQVACGVEVSQVYGSAETAGVGLIQPRGSSQLENIGCPFGSVELKMRDVGEWSHGNTRPSGELLIRGPTVMAGFYRQPERTAMVLESGGWLHTGDIVELQMDGTFRMVGLLRNEMRTAEGWSVDVESLERTLGTFELCQPDGVLVLVHPYRPFICALILTDATRTRNFIESNSDELQALGYPPVRWPLCLREPAFNKVAAQSLNRWARQHGIAPHEQLRSVRVLFDDWDRRNGLRSATGRLRRRAVEQRYAAILEELFAETPEDELSAAL